MMEVPDVPGAGEPVSRRVFARARPWAPAHGPLLPRVTRCTRSSRTCSR
jgi:hypothetical protein